MEAPRFARVAPSPLSELQDQELLLDENGLSEYGPDAARTQESNKSNDDMDEEDDEIAHLFILPKPGIAWGFASN